MEQQIFQGFLHWKTTYTHTYKQRYVYTWVHVCICSSKNETFSLIFLACRVLKIFWSVELWELWYVCRNLSRKPPLPIILNLYQMLVVRTANFSSQTSHARETCFYKVWFPGRKRRSIYHLQFNSEFLFDYWFLWWNRDFFFFQLRLQVLAIFLILLD